MTSPLAFVCERVIHRPNPLLPSSTVEEGGGMDSNVALQSIGNRRIVISVDRIFRL
jgi:hypothetical protein